MLRGDRETVALKANVSTIHAGVRRLRRIPDDVNRSNERNASGIHVIGSRKPEFPRDRQAGVLQHYLADHVLSDLNNPLEFTILITWMPKVCGRSRPRSLGPIAAPSPETTVILLSTM
jgi:hypothetical protein